MKVLAAFFRYDYGEPRRGPSNEAAIWVDQIRLAGVEVDTFFFEDHGYPNNLPGLQNALVDHVDRTRPDVTFFMFMRDEIGNETLDRLRGLTKTVNWFCDDQWRFDSYSVHRAPHLDLCLTVDRYCREKYLRAGLTNVRQVSWGPSHEMPETLELPGRYEFDVSFVGQINPTRAWIVEELRHHGVAVTCFGPGWPNGKVSFERMQQIFLGSRINLNLSNSIPNDRSFLRFERRYRLAAAAAALKTGGLRSRLRAGRSGLVALLGLRDRGGSAKNREQMKARYFEIPACGGFQIGRMVLGLEDYLTIGREVVVYTDVHELAEQVRYYLAHEDERRSIAEASFHRVRQYLYHRQLRAVFEDLR